MQPVVELRKSGDSYTYGVRAPRAGGVVPPVSFRDGGFPSLTSCLLHVAHGLGADFPRIYVRLEGLCVGERDIAELRRQPAQVAAELEADLRAQLARATQQVQACQPSQAAPQPGRAAPLEDAQPG